MLPLAPMSTASKVGALLGRLRKRYSLNVPELVADVVARIRGTLPTEDYPLQPDMKRKNARFWIGRGGIENFAFRTRAIEKLVVSRIALSPIIEGFAVTLFPRPDLDAPVLGAAAMLLPMRMSFFLELCSSRYEDPTFMERWGARFAPIRARFPILAGVGPAWSREIASGYGLQAKMGFDHTDQVLAALHAYLDEYLSLLGGAGAVDREVGRASQERFFRIFSENDPARRPLPRLFGNEWTSRYSRVLFGPAA